MKKFTAIFLILLFALTSASCGSKKPEPSPSAALSEAQTGDARISDYFPRTENRVMYYDGSAEVTQVSADGETSAVPFEIHTVEFQDYLYDTVGQRRTLAWISGTESSAVEISEIRDGGLYVTGVYGNFSAHYDMTEAEPNQNLLILREPLETGAKWTRYDGGGGVSETCEITSMDEEVTVPYGTFGAMVVRVDDASTGKVSHEYYVKGLGRVKTEIESPLLSQVEELSQVEDEPLKEIQPVFSGWTADISLFDGETDIFEPRQVYNETELEFTTNADVKTVYMDAARAYIAKNYGHELDASVYVNDIVFDSYLRNLKIDMSEGFREELGEAGDGEREVLRLLADTMAYLYGAYEVSFSIDGEVYIPEGGDTEGEGAGVLTPSMYQPLAGKLTESQYMELARNFISQKYGYDVDEAVVLNGLHYDAEKTLLRIDMSRAFVNEMNKAGDREQEVLQRIADAFVFVYGGANVTFSVEGGVYVSDNITIDPAEGDFIIPSMLREDEGAE